MKYSVNVIEINRSFVSTGCPDKFAMMRHRCRKEGVTVGNLALAATWMAMAQVRPLIFYKLKIGMKQV